MAEYNESQINSNETERISAEQQRINNEAKRQTNETEREAREATRQSNESTRISEYNTFITDIRNGENERIANEEERVEAEANRVLAEGERQAQESNRVNAEQDRVTRINEMEATLNEGVAYINNLGSTVDDTIATAKSEMTTQVIQGKADMEVIRDEAVQTVNEGIEVVRALDESIDEKILKAESDIDEQINQGIQDIQTRVNQGISDMEVIRDEAVQTVTDETNHAIETINETMWNGCVTPQMYGAVADGVVDDTIPVQNALNSGKSVYFPAGRYKVTSLLQVTNACKITMYKPYPCAYRGDYPLTEDDNHMGCRIETYSTNGGIIVGDGVEIDGFYMRAMNTFRGVLFKYDGTMGQTTYPSRLRLAHIILDNNSIYTVPEAMFDFVPAGTYHHILEDITIGSLRGRQFCEYGFRSIMTTSDTNWANSVRIKNLCIDILADYSLYVEGGSLGCANWVFDCPTIQTYPYIEGDSTYLGKPGHIDIVTFKNMQDVLITGGIIWDLHAASYNRIFNTENSPKIATYCANTFDQIDTYLSEKLQTASDNLNLENMNMTLVGDATTGGNYLTLSDGTNNKSVLIPGAILDDEQVNAGISNWFSENASPVEQVGRNKYNPNDSLTQSGYYYTDGAYTGMFVDEGNGMHTSNPIEAKQGDVIRLSKNNTAMGAYYLHMLDENQNWLSAISWNDDAGSRIIDNPDTKYIRITWSKGYFTYEDRATSNVCVTVNNGNISYTPYTIELVGGIGSYLVLQSPNGTQFTLQASDAGVISGKCVNGSVEPPIYVTKSELDQLRTEIGLEITQIATLLGGDA